MGLDGCGKSANINQMKLDKDFAGYKFVWVRWKPILLKPAYWILNRKISTKSISDSLNSENTINCEVIQGSPQPLLNETYSIKKGIKERIFSNPFVRSLWILIAVIDYFIQFCFKMTKLNFGKSFIIFDRSYLDLFIDQGINFGFSPEQVEQLITRFQWLFPKLDLILYIKVSPDTCLRRKNDIPNIDYLLKRYVIYEYLSKKSNWKSIDGEKPFNIVNNGIKQVIFNK
jgi:thymidylate kinase